jgi:Putative Flp pilus-assembly TadE/G-like
MADERDAGQVLPLAAAMVAVVAAALIALVPLARALEDRARARTAADAAALAGAAGGEAAARRLAAADGGRLVRFTPAGSGGTEVVVVVRVGRVAATARAGIVVTTAPSVESPGGPPRAAR